MSFDAHGNRRDADTWSDAALAPGVPANTTRGFTGHEHIDAANIVHMNGRLYDPALGRMLSADPIVQELFNAQNLNRYTYALNNPLSFTDPTGLSFFRKYWRTIVSVALTAFVPALAPAAWSNLAVAAATGFVAGVITSGTLQGGLFGAFSAVLFHGIGEYFDNLAKINISDGVFGSGLTVNQFASKVLSHAIAGGIMNRLQGGKFGDGFASAGVTQALSPAIGRVNSGNRGFSPLRVAVAAMVGGTASAAGGGKFANGAVTAAFSYAFGQVARREVGGQREGASDQAGVSLEVGGSRSLTEGEIAMSKDIFGDDIDYSVPRVFRRTYAPVGQREGVAVTPNGNIYFHPSDYVDDFSAQGISGRAWFIHEMTHVWQHQQGINVALRGIFSRRYDYLPLKSGKAFRSYGIEQQGDIVRDYYLLRQGYQVQGAPPITAYQSLLPFGR
ncbi:MAG: RHS repeat-associated core domain-containing protein [Lysobacterales bacterium]